MTTISPSRGEIWMGDLESGRGHEQAGRRPLLIISDSTYNRGPASLVIVLPITSKAKNIASHIAIVPPEGGLKVPSFIMCEAIRSISKERLTGWLGTVSNATLSAVEAKLKAILCL
ncbi:MAG: type II toxin-antitoxin system PemK/MazF family toxin [Acidobacteriota bacterium]